CCWGFAYRQTTAPPTRSLSMPCMWHSPRRTKCHWFRSFSKALRSIRATCRRMAFIRMPPASPRCWRMCGPHSCGCSSTDMQKIWLKEYPPGVPQDVDVNEYPSLVALADDALRRYADLDAYVMMDRAIRYSEVDRLAAAFACWLQAQGCVKGDRIALMLPNVLQYPIAMIGALRAGLVVVNTNPLYTADELKHQLNDAGATVIVVLENFCSVVQQVKADTKLKHVVVASVGELLPALKGAVVDFVLRNVQRKVPAWRIDGAQRFKALIRAHEGQRPRPVALSHDDLAYLQYTGGTTGVAKGAMLTHGNMVANVLQAHGWFQQ